jgi:hypothetical protein
VDILDIEYELPPWLAVPFQPTGKRKILSLNGNNRKEEFS